jgi:paraquat-inducible protein B
MSTPPTPRLSRRPALPLVWIVPLLSLAIGGWLIYGEFKNRGPEITVEFDDCSGIEAGQTTLEYRGVNVGLVRSIELAPDLRHALVHVRLRRNAAELARQGSIFWIARPEIGFTGVRGLDTLFSGARVNVRPGSGPKANHFIGSAHPPAEENAEQGRAFILESDKLNSLSPGAPVYFREVKVGFVETSRLANDSGSVLIRIRVRTPFADLVRTNTRFWVAGGPSFKMSLLGAEFRSTSLESLFSGGAAFATPDGELAPLAQDGALFRLHDEPEKEWLKWRPKIPILSPESTPDAKAQSKVPALVTP